MNHGGDTMSEYTWSVSETKKIAKKIPIHCIPARFALTATVVVRQTREGICSILLCNPRPDSWNNWLLPFGALVLNRPDTFQSAPTFKDISSYITSLRNKEKNKYTSIASEEISKMLGVRVEEDTLKNNPFLENFSLKYSKTANVWTAYFFSYYIIPTSLDKKPQCSTIWFPLKKEFIEKVTRLKQYSNLPVAGNVLALLANKNSIDFICDNIII